MAVHGVGGIHGADDRRPALIAFSVLDAGALHVGNGNKILPNLARKVRFYQIPRGDIASASRRAASLSRVIAPRQRTAESRPREGLAVYHAVRKAESISHHADLVFEKQLYRLYQLEIHILGQPADVVMRLYAVRLEDIG